jgi:hypothetical protein
MPKRLWIYFSTPGTRADQLAFALTARFASHHRLPTIFSSAASCPTETHQKHCFSLIRNPYRHKLRIELSFPNLHQTPINHIPNILPNMTSILFHPSWPRKTNPSRNSRPDNRSTFFIDNHSLSISRPLINSQYEFHNHSLLKIFFSDAHTGLNLFQNDSHSSTRRVDA